MDVDLRALDLNLLVALDAFLEHRSVTGAARALGLTQPAASRALQRLRDALGDPVLVRVGRGVVPTERAVALRGPVSDALRAARRVFAPPDDFDPATDTGELALALGDEAQAAFADAIVAAVWAAAPGVDVRVRPLGHWSLDEARRGVLDVGIGPDLAPLPRIAGTVDYGDFVTKPLYTRRFVVVRSTRAPAEPMTLARFVASPHVLVSLEGGGRGFVDELLAARGLSRRVAVSVTSFPSAARLVAANPALVSTLPEEVVFTAQADVVALPPPIELPPLPMLCVWHPRRNADARHRCFRNLVMRVVRERAATWGAGAAA